MILDTLITDRTLDDVERLRELKAKLLSNTATTAERNEWLAGLKGAYNYTDLNRVGQAQEYILAEFESAQTTVDTYRESCGVASDPAFVLPFVYSELPTKTDWAMTDIPSEGEMQDYLDTTRTMGVWCQLHSAEFKSLPTTMNNLDYNKANTIETVLLQIDQRLSDMIDEYKAKIDYMAIGDRWCGQMNCGG